MIKIKEITNYLNYLISVKSISKNSYISYQFDLIKFQDFIIKENIHILDISSNNILSYIKLLYKNNLSQNTIARHISAINNLFLYLVKYNKIKENPLKDISLKKNEKKIPNILNKKDIIKLIDNSYNDKTDYGIRLSAMIELLYATGVRISELISIKREDIRLKEKIDDIEYNYILVNGKGNKERIVPINNKSIIILSKYLSILDSYNIKSQWLFPSIRLSKKNNITNKSNKIIYKDQKITRQRFNQMLTELVIKSGMNKDIITPHLIRHSFATHLLSNGLDLYSLQKLLGHENLITTQIYTHISDEDKKKMLEKHHPMVKWK